MKNLNFKDINFNPKLKEGLDKLKYKSATKVQEKAIPAIIEGKNILCKSHTGSGKTLAFGIPLSNRIIEDPRCRVLILEPTRELAVQVKTELNKLNRYSKLSIVTVYGGHGIQEEIKKLSKTPDFVVATPGRLIDHFRRGSIKFNFDTVVLDEADRMLDMGFISDMNEILEKTKPKNIHLFSATLEGKVASLISKYMKNYVEVTVPDEIIGKNIIEKKIDVKSNADKISELKEIIAKAEGQKVLVFVSTKRMVDKLTENINNSITDAVGIHGDKTQRFREYALQDFKRGRAQVLVATDVAARGLQINDIGFVVNYDPAGDSDTHKHRIGRTGRMGDTGHAITFTSPEDLIPKRRRGSGSRGTRGKPSGRRPSTGGNRSGPSRGKFSKGPKRGSKSFSSKKRSSFGARKINNTRRKSFSKRN